MLIDMHLHTYRYSSCSFLSPADLISRAEELKLSGVVITEHNRVWSLEEVQELKEATNTDLVVLRAQEVSSTDGHVLVYGCYEKLEYLNLEEIVEEVHKCGGIVLPSHPFRHGDYDGFSIEQLRSVFTKYDGIEVLNGNQSAKQNNEGLAAWEELGIVGIGGSDAHSSDMVGKFLTEFDKGITDEHDLISEIKAGRCRPIRPVKYVTDTVL